MQNLQRNHALTFRVTAEERDKVRGHQKESGILSMRKYLLEMATKGKINHIKLESIYNMNRLLSNISNNINQIARRVNADGGVYAADLQNIQARHEEIWDQQKTILLELGEMVGRL